MQKRLFAGLLLGLLIFLVRGDAQSPNAIDKPVWTVELIKVRPEKFGLTLGYLDDNWMRVREEAKRQGAVLSYHRISEAVLLTPGTKSGDQNSMILLTEYKDSAAYFGREKLFASILKHLPNSPGVLPTGKQEDLFETLDTRVFMEVPAETSSQLKLLAHQ
jgi:hypothetical protein